MRYILDDLSKRFIKYFNLSYLIDRNSRYSKFSLEILEYCDKADLLMYYC